MNLDLVVIGQLMFVFAVVVGLVSYFLGRRKVENPLLAGVIGFVFSIVPVFGLLYVVVLITKDDLDKGREDPS